jgi:hypothetical protein
LVVVIVRSPISRHSRHPSRFASLIDLARGLTELLLADAAKRQSILAKLSFPGRRLSKGDQITGSLVQLGQGRPRVGASDITTNRRENSPHPGLVVDFTVDVSISAHRKPPFNKLPLRVGLSAFAAVS